MSQNYVTEEGLKKLKEELHMLKSKERPRISAQIAEARDKGDLSENAEYDAAKEAQGLLELKISKLEEIVRNSKVVDGSKLDSSKVSILSKVKLKNGTGKVMTYWIVPETEANLKEGKISVDSPIARGLLGKKVGEKVDVQAPAGKITFEVIEIGK
ncbi:MAG TPA: transcription elongation factor GreA [Bacteroidia bacterium]